MSDIRKKVFSGLFWTYAERFLAQIISLLITIVLARLLSPNEYGMIGILSVFMVIADSFAVNGLGNALVQKKDADNLDFSSVFYFNILFSIVIYLAAFAIAPIVAAFYGEPLLKQTMRVMALRIPIAAVNSVQHAYVSKKMQFKKFFYSTLIGTVVSGFVGIGLAYKGFGVWALVAQYMTNTCIDTLVLWFTVEWRLSFAYSWKRTRELYSYGWKILAASLLITIYSNVQDLIIGKKYSSADLAYCNKGKQFPSIISTNINTSIIKVLFPVMSEYQEDLETIKKMVRKAISVGAYILMPLLIGLAAIGDEIVVLILTEKWLPCVVFLRIMCLTYSLQPIQMTSIQTMKAIGRSDLYLRLEILKKVIGIIILLITLFFFDSVVIIILGTLLSEICSMIINMPFMKKLLKYSIKEQLEDFCPPLIMCIIMFFAVYSIHFLDMILFGKLCLQVITGIIVFVFLSWITKNKVFFYLNKAKR